MSLNPHHDERPARGGRRARPGDVDDLADRFGRMAPHAATEGLDEPGARRASLADRVVRITCDLARQYRYLPDDDVGREQVIDLIREMFRVLRDVELGPRGANAGRGGVHDVASSLRELETLIGRAIDFHNTFERYGGYTNKRSRMPIEQGGAARPRVPPPLGVVRASATTHDSVHTDSDEEPLFDIRSERRSRGM